MEFTGLMHFVYLIQKALVEYKGTPEAKKKQVENQGNPIAFWGRVLISTVVLALSLATVIESLFNGDTNFASLLPGMPDWSGFIFFIVLLCVVCSTEGLQVALFAMQKMDPEEFKAVPSADANAAVAFAGTNLQGFLIGRQVLTAMSMFMLSNIASVQADLTDDDGNPRTVFGVSEGFSAGLLETGLLGALVLTILGSLSGQVMASAFPLGFCGFPGMWIVLYACLLVEFIGLTHIAWPLADWIQAAMGDKMQDDEVYMFSTNHIVSPGEDRFLVGHNDIVHDDPNKKPVEMKGLETELESVNVKADM